MLRLALRLMLLTALLPGIRAQEQQTTPVYEVRASHDENGIGKFFMGREIAQVKKEMTAHPRLGYAETIATLPRQHIIVFRKK